MKTLRSLTMMAVALVMVAGVAVAQEPGPVPTPPEGPEAPDAPFPPRPFGPGPVLHALDADGDGTLSAEEMDGAPAALRALDEDGDGVLSVEEIRHDRVPFARGARGGRAGTGRAGPGGRAFAGPGRGGHGRVPFGRGVAPRVPMAPRGRMAPRVPSGVGRYGGRAFGRRVAPGAFGRGAVPFAPGELPDFAGERFFLRFDENEDGSLSEDEVPESLWERFADIDGDGDGVISREEMETGFEQRLEEMRGTWRELRRRDRPGTDQDQNQNENQSE